MGGPTAGTAASKAAQRIASYSSHLLWLSSAHLLLQKQLKEALNFEVLP